MLFWPYGCINGRYGFALALRSISGAYAFALTGRCYGDGRHNPGCRSLLRSFACPGLCAFAPSGRFVVADCAKGFRLAEIKRSVATPLSPPNFLVCRRGQSSVSYADTPFAQGGAMPLKSALRGRVA